MTKTIYAIIIVLLIGIGYVALSQRSAVPATDVPAPAGETSAPLETTNPASGTPAAATDTQQTPAKSGFTRADVAAHADASSCYAIVGQSVYDLTSWIAQHPGGQQAILGLCGTDGTAAFTKQHGGQRKAEQALANFRIGALTD